MSDHAIAWTHDLDTVAGAITCSAVPKSWCRMSCATQECGEWDALHEHGLADSGVCQAVEWFNAYGSSDLTEFGPAAGHVHDGPVTVSYSDGWVWEYADAPAASAEPSPEAVEAAARVLWSFATNASLTYPWDVVPEDDRERVRSHAADILRAGAGL